MKAVGFFDTPSKFADGIASLDASVRKLEAAITASKAPSVNAAWRMEWHAYVRRWELERDAYADWGSRLFLLDANARLSKFREHYLWWAKDFEKRSGVAVATKASAPVKEFSASMVPTELWWVVGAAAVAYVLSKRI